LEPSDNSNEIPNTGNPNPIYYVSFLGLVETMEYLRIEGLDINTNGGRYGNALEAAAVNKQEGAIKLLLKYGADVEIKEGEYGNAIVAAKNSKAIVRLLIEAGAGTSH
jgi:ankyrin repeat domain-containing protein 50